MTMMSSTAIDREDLRPNKRLKRDPKNRPSTSQQAQVIDKPGSYSALHQAPREVLEKIFEHFTHNELREVCKAGKLMNHVGQQFLWSKATVDLLRYEDAGKADFKDVAHLLNGVRVLTIHMPYNTSAKPTRKENDKIRSNFEKLVNSFSKENKSLRIISFTPGSMLDRTTDTLYTKLLEKTRSLTKIMVPTTRFDYGKGRVFTTSVWLKANRSIAKGETVIPGFEVIVSAGADIHQVRRLIASASVTGLSLIGKRSDQPHSTEDICTEMGFSKERPMRPTQLTLTNLNVETVGMNLNPINLCQVKELKLLECKGTAAILQRLSPEAARIEKFTLRLDQKPNFVYHNDHPYLVPSGFQEDLINFLQAASNLRELTLHLTHSRDIETKSLFAVLSRRLEVLSICTGGDEMLSSWDLRNIASRCPCLRGLGFNSTPDRWRQWQTDAPGNTRHQTQRLSRAIGILMRNMSIFTRLEYVLFFEMISQTTARELNRASLEKRSNNKMSFISASHSISRNISTVFWRDFTGHHNQIHSAKHYRVHTPAAPGQAGVVEVEMGSECDTEERRILEALSGAPINSLSDLAMQQGTPFQLRHERDFSTHLG